jgi:hypothetical protein
VEVTEEAKAELAKIENKIGDYICQLCKEIFDDAFGLAQHRYYPRTQHKAQGQFYDTWDRFYETPFRSKTFRTNFYRKILDKFQHPKQHIYLNISEFYGK